MSDPKRPKYLVVGTIGAQQVRVPCESEGSVQSAICALLPSYGRDAGDVDLAVVSGNLVRDTADAPVNF